MICSRKMTASFACIKFTPRRMPTTPAKLPCRRLWDRERRTIVNNESSEIIRMFNASFRAHTDASYDFYPEKLRGEIEHINDLVYSHFNNGVYRAGFARSQEAYEEAVKEVFVCLDHDGKFAARAALSSRRSDYRSRLARFPTLLRFDPVYHSHFKCNLRRIQDYPNLANYLRELYQWPGIKETLDLDKTKAGYYSQRQRQSDGDRTDRAQSRSLGLGARPEPPARGGMRYEP